jgi:uncharacterized membrane protein YciS (DUF1049 family)
MNKRLGLYIAVVFILGLLLGLLIRGFLFQEEKRLPRDLEEQFKRFRFINKSMNLTLKDYRIMDVTVGTYESGGTRFETYILAYEDRPGGASADLDYFDLLVEIKRSVDDGKFTIRMVQLGLDTIDVFLDNNFVGSLRPAIELEVPFLNS